MSACDSCGGERPTYADCSAPCERSAPSMRAHIPSPPPSPARGVQSVPAAYDEAAVSQPDLSNFPERGANGLGPCGCGDHSCGEFHRAVAAELVACTLGQRKRPELRTDPWGQILHAWNRARIALRGMLR